MLLALFTLCLMINYKNATGCVYSISFTGFVYFNPAVFTRIDPEREAQSTKVNTTL